MLFTEEIYVFLIICVYSLYLCCEKCLKPQTCMYLCSKYYFYVMLKHKIHVNIFHINFTLLYIFVKTRNIFVCNVYSE